MRKLIVSMSAAATIAVGALAATQTGASASTTMLPLPGGAVVQTAAGTDRN